MLFACILVAAVGAVFVALGLLLWKKEKITLLHDYHYASVAEADKKDFCRLSGQGVLCIGIGLLPTAVLLFFTGHPASFLCFAAGFAVGIGLLVTAGRRYNV